MHYQEICPKCNTEFTSETYKLVGYCPKCGNKVVVFKNEKRILMKPNTNKEKEITR